jgi:hypothetical protein
MNDQLHESGTKLATIVVLERLGEIEMVYCHVKLYPCVGQAAARQ